MTNVYFNLTQCEEMARNLWVYLCTHQGVKSAKSMSAGSEAEGRKTEGRASIEHPFSIHSASIQHPLQSGGNKVKTSLRFLRYVAMIFAVLVMSVANIGMAWGASPLTIAAPSQNVTTQDGVTVAATASTGKIRNKSSQKVFVTNSASSIWIYSQLTNITSISFDVCYNSGTTGSANAFDILVATGGAFAVPSSGEFTATKNEGSLASLSNINVVGSNATTATSISVTFTSPVKAIILSKNSYDILVENLSISYDAGTLPTTYFAAHISGTNAATIDTNPGGASTTVATNGSAVTINSQSWLKLNSGGISIDLGSNKFQVGDQIVLDIAGSGTNKAVGAKIQTGSGTDKVAFTQGKITNTFPVKLVYVVTSGDGIAGTSTAKMVSTSTDDRYYSWSILRAAADCEDVAAPTGLTCSAQTQTSLTYTWSKASHASTYTAKLYSDSGCESEVKSSDLGDVATVTFSDLTAGTTYYCKVQSHGDGSTYCAEGGTTSAASGTTSACTAISPTWSYPFSTVAVGITIYPTIGGNTGGGAVTYSSSATGKITNDCYATAAGSATLTANVAANGVYCSGSVTSGTITVVADQSGLIKQTLTTGNYEWGTPSAPATTDGTNITSTTVLSATNLTISGNGNTSNGGQTAKITGMTAGSESDNSGKYMQMGFTVKSGKQLNVSAIYIPVQPVSSDVNNFKAVLSDGETTITGTLTNSKNGKLAYIKFDSYGTVKGDVTLTLYAWGWTGGYRLGKSIVIDGEIEDAPSSCTEPSSVGISGEWRYFPGQTISLTATPTGGVGTPTYQWQKEISADNWQNISNGTEAGVTISGATSNNLQISSCGTGNTGKYRCIVSTGATCSTTSDPFSVKIFTLNGAYDDGEFTSNNITFTSGTTGTATVHLAAGRVYKFKVTDNFGMWFGNSGRILEPASSWTFPSNNDDNCILFTGPEGDYTFTVDIAHVTYGTPEVVVSVAYPDVTHPSAGYAYFKNVDSWTNVGLYMWYEGGGSYTDWGSEPWVTRTTTICGNTYYYTPLIPSWYNRAIFREVGGSGQTGNIEYANLAAYSGKYNDKSDANWHDFTTYTISFAGNGNTGGSMSAIEGICPNSSQAITANAFEKTGYTFNCWHADKAVQVGGSTIPAGGDIAGGATLQEINNDITLTAQWTVKTTNITLDKNNSDPGSTNGSATVTYGSDELATYTAATRTGYTISSYKTETSGGYIIIKNDGSLNSGDKGDILDDGHWSYDGTALTLYAQWEANKFDVTHTLSHVTRSSGGEAGSNKATYGTAYSVVFAADGGYTLPATVTVTVAGSDVTANCTWNQSTGALTIPAAYVTGAIVITITGESAGPTYTVTYEYNGANGGSRPASATGASVTLPEPTKTGYELEGWYTTAGAKVDDGGETYSPTADITLYARWTETCSGGGGGSTTLFSTDFTESGWSSLNNTETAQTLTIGGHSVYVRANNTGYLLSVNTNTGTLTWGGRNFSNRDCYLAIPVTGVNGSLTITVDNGATATRFTYAVVAGSTIANPSSTSNSDSADPSECTVENLDGTSYVVFIGRQGSGFPNATSISITTPGGGSSSACNKVLYHGNGAESGYIYDPTVYDDGGDPVVLGNTTGTNGVAFVKDGFVFQGWATSEGGSVAYTAGNTISDIDDDVDLYAVWAEVVPCTPVAAPTSLTCSAQTSSSLTFTWTKADHASTYTAKLYSDAGCTSQVASQDLGNVATVTFSTLTAETTYYCKIQSHGDGSTYCADGGTTAAQSGTTDAACSAHELAYATGAVAKNVGDAAFTNPLTNPNSLSVTYSSSNTSAATVNATSGMVTIEGAGVTTITADWAGDATYCAGSASYTLTVSSGCTPQSIVKTQLTSTTAGTTTGYNDKEYAGDPVIATFEGSPKSGGYKLKSGSKLFVTLKKGNFVAGDKINIVITQASDLTYTTGKLLIFYNASSPALLTTIDAASAGTYTYTLTASDITTLGSVKTIGVYRSSGSTENNPYVKSVEVEGCREWTTCTAPDAIAAGSVTDDGATFTITDAENTNNYEIYYSTGSTAPTAETSATTTAGSKTKSVTGLTSSTTYYYWVRSNCGGVTKSSWVAGTPTSFTTEAAGETNSVTYHGNGSTGGSVPTDATAYEEGDIVTVKGNTGSLVKTEQTFLGWSTNATPSSGTFYPAGYKFYMPASAVTLYAVWGSAAEERYYYGFVKITDGALVKEIPSGSTQFFTNSGGVVANSTAISLSSTPNTGSVYYNSNNLTDSELSKSSNWGSGSTSDRYIRGLKFANGSTYTLALGSKTATSIKFYGWCGSASKTMTVGGQGYESPSTQNTFFSHEYTKAGNFTGNVSITQDGDFYGILVVTVSTGAGSNYTVTFNMNGKGSAIEPITDVPSGSKIGAPVPSPTAVGAEFGGWYREAGCTNAWNFGSSTISKDTTLYAKWTTCAPSISAHPVAATYTQGDDATALSVTASGEGLNYQWYTSEDGSADIQGSSAIPGATSASYTPSTSLLGTIYYFCVVSNTCGNAVSSKAAITVNDGRPIPTANWDIEEPKEGGKGFTFSIEVNKNNGENWDGELIASMLTLSDNAILDGASIEVNNTDKTISGTYGVKAGSSSPVTFYLLLPATATQSATRLDHDRTFTPCAGGAGDNYTVRVRKDYEKDASNNYRWVTPGAGEITYAVSSSISSAKAASTVASVFDSIMSNDKQYVWVKTYEANTKTIRLYVETSGANVSVSALYKNTVYATAADKDIVSSDDYSVSYDGSGSAENTGAKGTHYMDITFDSPLAANDIICVKFSSSKVKAYGAILTTVGDGGDQTTGLSWSNGQASGATLVKREDAADFAITAVRDATALKSLGLISYTSSNTAIATIDGATGLVHIADNIDFGSDEYKTTTITATLAASGCYKKAVITYILKVTKHECEDTPGTITYVDRGCSGMDLTLEGYEEGATIKWYKNGTEIPSATSATYNATEPGEYYAVTHKTCDITSTNSITLEAATATAEKIVDSWYVKNGRRTPDIALVHTTGATSFTVTSGGTPVENIGGCTFELKDDGIIYLHGQKDDGSAPSDMTPGDMTITITVSGCAGALSGLDITLHIQAETVKPSVAFVVDGTLRKDGGSATSVLPAKTSERPIWKYLANSFTLTGCNAYWSVDSKELRQYYSQFDAILITDDPSTYTKGAGGVEYVKAFGTMVDVRPILTLEAYVGRYSDGGWHVYNASPSSPNPRQVEMKLECKNHDIFKGLDPEASDNVRVTRDAYDNEYWHVIMVDTTVAPYHNTSKNSEDLPALQGFDPTKFDHMLGVGTIKNDALQAGVERQEEAAARMMILGIQNEAMAALTNEGKLIIKNIIDYLLKTNMEDVNDCSNYFTDATGDHQWNTAENWTSGTLPDFETRARILRPVIIPNNYKALVARVDIVSSGNSKHVSGVCTGSVTIAEQGALVVSGEVSRAVAPHYGKDNLEPTEVANLFINSTASGNGTLIFDNSAGDNKAEVAFFSKAGKVEGKKNYQYFGTPHSDVSNAMSNYYDSWIYEWSPTDGWLKIATGAPMTPWTGYCITYPTTNHTYYMEGTLEATGTVEINVPSNSFQIIGNSWTAPIQIDGFEDDDFGDITKTIYFFNTGVDEDGTGEMDKSGGRYAAGTYVSVPIHAAPYTGDASISSLQGFYVANPSGSDQTLTLDYQKIVRPKTNSVDVRSGPMHAPKRVQEIDEDRPIVAKFIVSGVRYDDKLTILERGDFRKGYDDGWDGEKWDGGNTSAPLVWAVNEDEGVEMVTATPDMNGTIIGFRAGENDEYTFYFEYDDMAEALYLLDTDTRLSTRVLNENSYTFTCADKGEHERFILTRTIPQIPTGVDDAQGEKVKAKKLLLDQKLYILLNGVLYDATGKVVK